MCRLYLKGAQPALGRPGKSFFSILKAKILVTSSTLLAIFVSTSAAQHLASLQDSDKMYCQVCDMPLDHSIHLQNHAGAIEWAFGYSYEQVFLPVSELQISDRRLLLIEGHDRDPLVLPTKARSWPTSPESHAPSDPDRSQALLPFAESAQFFSVSPSLPPAP